MDRESQITTLDEIKNRLMKMDIASIRKNVRDCDDNIVSLCGM